MSTYRIAISCVILFAISATADSTVYIIDASYNHGTEELNLNIAYGGGNLDHEFELDIEPHKGSGSQEIVAQLKHTRGAGDDGIGLIFSKRAFDLAEIPKPSHLEIRGEKSDSITVKIGRPEDFNDDDQSKNPVIWMLKK